MTQQKLEQLLEIFKQKYFQGDSYYCRFNNKGDKCIVGYKNDYPMQHGDGKEWQIPTEVADMLVSQIEPPVKPEIAKVAIDGGNPDKFNNLFINNLYSDSSVPNDEVWIFYKNGKIEKLKL